MITSEVYCQKESYACPNCSGGRLDCSRCEGRGYHLIYYSRTQAIPSYRRFCANLHCLEKVAPKGEFVDLLDDCVSLIDVLVIACELRNVQLVRSVFELTDEGNSNNRRRRFHTVSIGELREVPLLFIAVQSGSAELVHFLLERGADAKSRSLVFDWNGRYDPDSWSIHQIRPGKDSQRIAELLIDYARDPGFVNVTDSGGFTAIYQAAHHGDMQLAAYLVSRGAEIDFVGAKETPAETARKHGHKDVAAYLERAASYVSASCGVPSLESPTI